MKGRITDLLYNESDINKDYYQKIKNLDHIELEHNIGRLINFKTILHECKNLPGHIIEFGTWQGFSLLWIAYLCEREAIFDKKIIGLDGFIGLPYQDGVFNNYDFADSSLELCRKNVYENKQLYSETKSNIHIEQFLFNQTDEIIEYVKNHNLKKFCFIHIDCDVSESMIEIFSVLIKGNLIADKAYILFDDYYCDSNFQKTFEKVIKPKLKSWNIKKHSRTALTQNFIFTKKVLNKTYRN